MPGFEDQINSILSNPEAMAQIMGLAQSLHLGDTGKQPEGPQPAGAPADQTPPSGGASGFDSTGAFGGLGSLQELLGKLDPKLIQRLLPLAGELFNGGGNDERLQLLHALGPFLKPERREKIEQAAKTAHLLHLGKKFLFSAGDLHV